MAEKLFHALRHSLCALRTRPALMCDPVTKSNFKESIKNNFQIKKKRSIPEIVLFELDLDRDREFVSAVDLGPSGQTGREFMNPFLGPKNVGCVLRTSLWCMECTLLGCLMTPK